jgi:hypothetical protein
MMFELRQFTRAIETVAQVMKDGAVSHPTDDWNSRPFEYHVARAIEHLHLWSEGDQQQDHLSHAATRLLMALTLREIS